VNKQDTWNNISRVPELKAITFLVCPPEEAEAHRAAGRNVIERPVNGIANVRRWIVELAQSEGTETVIMLDDDLAFFYRRSPDAYNLRQATDDDLVKIFRRLDEIVTRDGYVHAGLSPRQMNNAHFPATEREVMRMNAVHCVNARRLKELGVNYRDDPRIAVMEEYEMTLRLFKMGYPNRVIVQAAWDQCGVSGAPGGCALFRTSAVQTEGAHLLAELHPDVVTVVIKTPKNAGEGMANRTDVRIQWKKAFQKMV
jgi:hypothetical protein